MKTVEEFFHLRLVFASRTKQTCELEVDHLGGGSFTVRMESVAASVGPGRPLKCLASLSDIIVIVPSTAVESMQLGGLAGLTALTMGLGQERANGQKEAELKREA